MSTPERFGFQRDEVYLMPVQFGPRTADADLRYEDVTRISVAYQTDAFRAVRLLPPGFELDIPAVVTVTHAEFHGVGILAGGGYNLVTVGLGARWAGSGEQLQGNFVLVAWENNFAAVVTGREVLGWPNLLADIPEPWLSQGRRGFHVSEEGTLLLEAEAGGWQPCTEAETGRIESEGNDRAWLAWKYIPSDDGLGADVSHPTAMHIRSKITDAWHGAGSVRFHLTDRRHAPVSYRLLSVLAALPVESEPIATMTRGSQVLALGHRLNMTPRAARA
jgi:acetoacetate decarboxylase